MAEVIITPDVLSREFTMVLKDQAILHKLFKNPADLALFTGDEKIGETIKIVSPAPADVREFSGAATPRTAAQTTTDLVIEKKFFDQIEVSSTQMTLEIDRFSELYIQPIAKQMAEKMSAYAAEKIAGVPYHVGTAGAPPTTVDDITAIDRVMNTNKAPASPRIAVLDEFAKASIFAIEAFHTANKRGDGGAAMRAAELGDLFGFDWFMDQSILDHTAGTMQAETPLVDVGGGVLEDATVMDIDDAGAGSQTILTGDLFTVTGVPNYQGVFTNNTTASSGQITAATFFPAAPVGGFPDSNAVNIVASHTKNVAFVPGAFSFVTFPPTKSMGAPSDSFFDQELGLGIRITFDFSSGTLGDTISFDAFCGCVLKQAELAAVILG